MNRIFTYESYTPDPNTPGKGVFHNVVLLVSLFPYKRGTHFDKIVFDPINFIFIAHRKGKETSHRVQISLYFIKK